MAAVLGILPRVAQLRAARIPELKGQNGTTDLLNGGNLPPPPPNEAATLLRSPDQLPAMIPAVDLGHMVEVTEKLLGGGFDKLGVPPAIITKLRDLSALKIDAGAWLAVSLQYTHQNYFLQQMTLAARADEIRADYLDAKSPTYIKELTPTERMFWQRAHNECIEQMGRGYDRMMAGTEAMMAMRKGMGKDKAAPKSDAGWAAQVPKSVARANGKSQH